MIAAAENACQDGRGCDPDRSGRRIILPLFDTNAGIEVSRTSPPLVTVPVIPFNAYAWNIYIFDDDGLIISDCQFVVNDVPDQRVIEEPSVNDIIARAILCVRN